MRTTFAYDDRQNAQARQRISMAMASEAILQRIADLLRREFPLKAPANDANAAPGSANRCSRQQCGVLAYPSRRLCQRQRTNCPISWRMLARLLPGSGRSRGRTHRCTGISLYFSDDHGMGQSGTSGSTMPGHCDACRCERCRPWRLGYGADEGVPSPHHCQQLIQLVGCVAQSLCGQKSAWHPNAGSAGRRTIRAIWFRLLGVDYEATPLISVVLPVYNGAADVERAVGSVLTQTCDDFELILINDGSKDNSADVLESMRGSSGFACFHQDNIGLAGTLNRGIGLARGRYIARAGSGYPLASRALCPTGGISRYAIQTTACSAPRPRSGLVTRPLIARTIIRSTMAP